MNQPPQDNDLESVIHRYADMVYRLAFARAGNQYDAEEIFQDTFLRYVKKSPAFRDEEHRKAWLLRVTVNCSKKLLNSPWYKRTQPIPDDLSLTDSGDFSLYRELQTLPPKYRQVIHLFYYEDLPIEEIGRLLHRKNSTVRTQLTRARAMLRRFMKEEDYV